MATAQRDTGTSGDEADDAEPQGWWRAHRRQRNRVVGSLAAILLLFIALFGLVYARTSIPLPDSVNTAQTTTVTYADGRTTIVRIGSVNRTDVPLEQVSLDAQHAVLAAEDKNFYSESGISVRGIARAVWADLRGGQISQGGSTITQQYAKNAYLTQNRTFSRKIKEIALAIKLDRKYSKDEILDFYLNTIYFGRGAYGIQAAAKAYFNLPAAKLDPYQGAVLAGLIRAPSMLDPRVDPAAAKERFRQVLDVMAQRGWVDADKAVTAALPATVAVPTGGMNAPPTPQAAYIRDEVTRELVAAGIDADTLTRGGLTVTTTLDQRTQTAAETAVKAVTGAAPEDLQTGVVSMEPGTGRIKAWYGGSIYGRSASGREDYLDNVSASIQPGSSFKPITLAAALDKGISLDSRYPGYSPMTVDPGYPADNQLRNFGDEQFGQIDLRTALANSVNTVFVPLERDAGAQKVVDMAHTLGFPSSNKLTAVPSLTLGTEPVRPVDMAGVYGTFASQGMYAAPHIVEKVVDRSGNEIYSAKDSAKRVVSEGVTADATSAMQQVVLSGTGTAAQLNGRPVAGKTGTTTRNLAAWFCGFTPQLVTVVDMFRGDATQPLNGVLGINEVSGGTLPAQVFKATMDAALQGAPVAPFPPEAHVGKAVGTPSPTPTPPPASQTATVPTFSPSPLPTPTPAPTTETSAPTQTTPPPTTPAPTPSSSLGVVVGGGRGGGPGGGGPGGGGPGGGGTNGAPAQTTG